MNSFILGNNGFLKEFIIDENYKKIPIWTTTLRDAKRFNSSTARKIIDNGLEGFVWNPYVEEPVRDKYRVNQRNNNYTFLDKYKALDWYVQKVKMEAHTDAKFLNGDIKIDYYDFDEAVKICKQKNLEILEEVKQNLEKLEQQNINNTF